ncbi:MAG TPA: hypothetical protein PKD61_34550 [Polyangiaceae bacterium]|nr:hypothetical protein [Polyangiaceae bacterium]
MAWVSAVLGLMACGGAANPDRAPVPPPTLRVEQTASKPEPLGAVPVRVTTEPSLELNTPEALARALVETLRTGDDHAADTLLLSAEDITRMCPHAAQASEKWDRITAEFEGKLRRKFKQSFHDCRTIFDFSGAQIVEVRPEPIETEDKEDCGAPVETSDDISIVVQSGHSRYTFRIDDAVRTPQGWKTADLLRCATSQDE